MIEEITGAGDKVRSSVEEKSTIVSKERKPDTGCCAALALRLLTHDGTIRTRAKLGLGHRPIHRLHCRLHDEQEKHWALARAFSHTSPVPNPLIQL